MHCATMTQTITGTTLWLTAGQSRRQQGSCIAFPLKRSCIYPRLPHSVPFVISHVTANVEFGVIPKELMPKLCDKTNWQARTQAIDELQTVMMQLDDPGPILPHLRNLLRFLVDMLRDPNLKVVMTGLQVCIVTCFTTPAHHTIRFWAN